MLGTRSVRLLSNYLLIPLSDLSVFLSIRVSVFLLVRFSVRPSVCLYETILAATNICVYMCVYVSLPHYSVSVRACVRA